MVPPRFPIAAQPRAVGTCAECGVPLAPGQRYCVSCGARCAPVPPGVAERLAQLAGRPAPLVAVPDTGSDETERRASALLAAVTPRAAAVAAMSMLAFGVVVGSGASSLAANGPLLIAYSPHHPAPAPAQPTPSRGGGGTGGGGGGGGAGGGGGGGGTTVVTQTVTAQTVSAPGAASGGNQTTPTTPAPTSPTLPPVKHVFVIVLSGQGYQQLYGQHPYLPYLGRTLRHQGELLANYYAVAGSPLANEVALTSGQGPTQMIMFDCPQYTAVTPGTAGKGGQTLGQGCAYPSTTESLPSELVANGLTWRAYVEGMSTGPKGTPTGCRRPTLGSADANQAASAASPYATWRNPFVYFQSLTQSSTCARQDVSLEKLSGDLHSAKRTPSLVYIAPSPCDDGSGQFCPTGPPPASPPAPNPKAAAAATDAFLKRVVTGIERSPAYKAGGLIAITSDEAPQVGPHADPSACCNNPVYPNLAPASGTGSGTTGTTGTGTSTTTAGTTTSTTTPAPTTSTSTTSTGASTTTTTTTTSATAPVTSGQTTPTGGGGLVGLLLISPYVKAGSSDTLDYYNHYSLLGSIEALFSLTPLGYAKDPQLPVFDHVIYNAYKG